MSRLPESGSATRRGLLATLLGGGTAAASLSPADWVFERVAPLSGTVWESARDLPETVASPYGPASVTYDEYHVPHVEAERERAGYYALGYVQAADRLWQMDFLRRLATGSLSAVVGERMVESDTLYTKLDLVGAAEASREAIAGTDAERVATAFAEGVSAFAESNPPGVLFGLLEYEPEPWQVVDTILINTFMAWSLSRIFSPLAADRKRAAFDEETYRTLYPRRHDHDAPVVRDATAESASSESTAGAESVGSFDSDFVDWVSALDTDLPRGSNAWTIAGEHTESGTPIVAGDPHLDLGAPPYWYEQQLTAGDVDVRGIVTPGTPFPVIGENAHGAWCMTNATVDTADLYTYETDGDQYRYRDEWREFDVEQRTVAVRGGDDRDVTVAKTVHGPFLERDGTDGSEHVGVSWVGFTGTRTMEAGYRMTRSTGLEEFRDALRLFETPALNFHYADTDGRTLFQTAGLLPIRRVDGDPVYGDRVFDGSAGAGEWDGFEPYGQSSRDGFVPFEDKPAIVDAEYVASANQRLRDDPAYPLGTSFAQGYRAERIYERLDATVGAGETVDHAFSESLQLDSLHPLADDLVPAILEVRDRLPDEAESWLDALEDWDYRMDRDATAALLFDRFYRAFKRETWDDLLAERGLPRNRTYRPSDRVLLDLPRESRFFDGDRGDAIVSAMATAIDELGAEPTRWGEHNTTAFDHELGGLISGLNYPRYETDGSWHTLSRFDAHGSIGATYRAVMKPGGESRAILAGGNDGSPDSDHYHDQLEQWADGEYRSVGERPSGEPAVEFLEGER